MAVPTFDAASPLWAGVALTPQHESSEPLCPILYSPDFAHAMGLFRTLAAKHELSLRALALTAYLAHKASSNYTVWAYRFQLLCADLPPPPQEWQADPSLPPLLPVELRLRAELDMLDESCRLHLKQYQVWQHRKNVVVELTRRVSDTLAPALDKGQDAPGLALWHQLAQTELELTAAVLDDDAKNYHTWIHREWALVLFAGQASAPCPPSDLHQADTPAKRLQSLAGPGIWERELSFTDTMIARDQFNNSAWNHRYYVQFGAGLLRRSADPLAAMCGETTYTKNKIAVTKNNASPWAYLRGVFAQLEQESARLLSSGDSEAVARAQSKGRLAEQVRDTLDVFASQLSPSEEDIAADPAADTGGNGTPHALEWRLDSLEARLLKYQKGELPLAPDQVEKYCSRALHLLARLVHADPIRTRYWLDKRKAFAPEIFAQAHAKPQAQPQAQAQAHA